MMCWIYTAVIRPIISYASHSWYKKCSRALYGRKATDVRLQKVQRLALLLISGGMKSTPTDALEVIFNASPLFLFIENEAIMTL